MSTAAFVLFCALGRFCSEWSHQTSRLMSVAGLETRSCVQAWTSYQTLCANRHCRHKCSADSGAVWHKGHAGLQGQFRACNKSAVRIFSCSSNHVKKRCLGSACADQIQLGLKVQKEPLNCTSYADFAVYCPSAVNFQAIWSSASLKCTSCTKSHSLTNSAISSTVDIRHKPRVQLWFSNWSLTFNFLRQTACIGVVQYLVVLCLRSSLIPRIEPCCCLQFAPWCRP